MFKLNVLLKHSFTWLLLKCLISPDDSPLPPLIPQTPPPPTLESIESPAATPLLQTEGGLRQTEGGLWQRECEMR